MKLRFPDITKGACKILAGYFGFRVENVDRKPENRNGAPNLQTPDFYNGRMNGSNRKNASTTRRPQ